MLTDRERQWLVEEAQDTLGLTALRAKVLVAVLDRERYSIREIGRLTGMSPEQVRRAIEMLFARDLIEVRVVADPHEKAYLALAGRRLRVLLDAVMAALEKREPPQQPDASRNC